MIDEKTYQPGWEKRDESRESREKRHRHHHHRHVHGARDNNRGIGGALRMKDKQAYYGLMAGIIVAVLIGAYMLLVCIIKEVKALPMDDPQAELAVDELRIHKVAEQDALLAGDSLAQAYALDSTMIKRVQKDTRPVYRPPRKHDEWYITRREWKEIWESFKRK